MDRYGFDVHLTPAARELLRPDEALVLDWYRLAICCAGAGEASLYAMKEEKAEGRMGVRRFTSNLPGDFGLRAVMGRLPEPEKTAR